MSADSSSIPAFAASAQPNAGHGSPVADVLTIDPVAMQVTNRVAAGTQCLGEHRFEGGVLVQGALGGYVEVAGRLIVWRGGLVKGQVLVRGDLYLFGTLGEPGGLPEDTVVECLGTAYLASTAVSNAQLSAQRLRLYEGAELHGPFKTLKPGLAPPVLR
jgi:Polymer-forming cytoskeletal